MQRAGWAAKVYLRCRSVIWQGKVVKVQIHASARKHGISDADMLHAIRMAIRTYRHGNLVMYIGADQAGIRLLEVGVMDANDDHPLKVIHAMSARSKFL
jgi:hypothetical protein